MNKIANKLIVISAPSGGGKTTLCMHLLRDFPELTLSISCTTRAPRGQEKNGQEYFFISRAEFEAKIAQGDFAEWAEVHGNYYGTSKAVFEKTLASHRSVLLDIDVQGASSLKKSYGDRCATVFIAPPNIQELEKRLRNRETDSEETIQKRLKNARIELDRQSEFDYRIVNDTLERAYTELNGLVEKLLHGPGSTLG
ncbi:guanylate kinase [Bdellovibrionota bacterium FG-2]